MNKGITSWTDKENMDNLKSIAPKGWTEIEGGKEAGHTPLPWHRNIPPASKYPVIFSGRNTHVLQLETRGLPENEIEANAQFIVKAVNCHDELVEALGNLLCHHRVALHPQMTDTLKERIDAGRAILAKTKGEA